MKNLNYLITICLTLGISYMPLSASAQDRGVHPSVCEAVTSQQAVGLEWRRDGLINKHPSKPRWVSCPVYVEMGSQVVGVFATNLGEQAITLRCFYQRENDQVRPGTATIPPGKQGVVGLNSFWIREGLYDLVVCQLPPEVRIDFIVAAALP